jgi:signal transduction histidine kinase
MHLENSTKEELLREITDMRQQLAALQILIDARQSDAPVLAEYHNLLTLSAAVGTALAGNDSLRTILQRCAEAIVQHLGVASTGIWTLQPEASMLEMQANAGQYLPFGAPDGILPVGQSAIGRIAQERHSYVTNAVLTDAQLEDKAWAQRLGVMAFAGYPLLSEDRLVGVMAMFARKPFTPAVLKTLAWVAGVMAMGIDRMCMADALARSIAKVVRMNKCLPQKSAELDEVMYIASHDLQELLRKLLTFSGRLQKDVGASLPERAARDLACLTDAASHLHSLTQNLLEFSRLCSVAMYYEPVTLNACIDEALTALAGEPHGAAATITRDPLLTVWGDRAMLTQLYQHLLSNAFKFCKAQPPIIHCTAELHDGQIVFGVKDNGMGIPPEYHDQIFTPFKRLHARGEYAGAGIGLAICRKIVGRHGGRLWVESVPGQGAHFKFTLATAS